MVSTSAEREAAAAACRRWYAVALAAVDPEAAVKRVLRRDGAALVLDGEPLPVPGRVVVLALGKAALGMARAAVETCGDLVDGGLLVTKEGHAGSDAPTGIAVRESAHPIPDGRSLAAGQAALNLVGALGPRDTLLALISGGGSSLLEVPRPPATLADLVAATDLLLRAGAPIGDLNVVRTPLSLTKGGGLRRRAGAARVVTLLLSDVLGGDPRVIASGPTVPSEHSPTAALAVLDRYHLRDRVPPSVLTALAALPEAEAMPATLGDDRVLTVGDNATAVEALATAAAAEGRRPTILWRDREGEAADLGRAWVAACRAAPSDVDVLLGGGEATVTVRGGGVGGRNTEFALAAALTLEGDAVPDWVVASLATDGQDGPTGAAGAIADHDTAVRSRRAGVDPERALRENDSLRVFEAAGGVVAPGPTGTNVNDLYLAVRLSAADDT
jgi:hydroxypyruvate reductase